MADCEPSGPATSPFVIKGPPCSQLPQPRNGSSGSSQQSVSGVDSAAAPGLSSAGIVEVHGATAEEGLDAKHVETAGQSESARGGDGDGDGGSKDDIRMKRKRSSFNQKEKHQICEMARTHPEWTHATLRRWVRCSIGKNIGQSTISDILARPEKWAELSATRPDMAKRRAAQWPQVEMRLLAWIAEQGGANQLTGPAIRAQAVVIAKSLNHSNFHGTPGWYDGFCARHNIRTAKSRSKETPRFCRNRSEAQRPPLPDDEEHLFFFDAMNNSNNVGMLQQPGSSAAHELSQDMNHNQVQQPIQALAQNEHERQDQAQSLNQAQNQHQSQAAENPSLHQIQSPSQVRALVSVPVEAAGVPLRQPMVSLGEAQEGIRRVQLFARENTSLFTSIEFKMISTIASVMEAKAAQISLTESSRNGQHPFVARFQSFMHDSFPM